MLCLHSGAREITREALREIPIEVPDGATERWKGVQHGEWADLLVDAATRVGLKMKSEKWGIAGNQRDPKNPRKLRACEGNTDLFGVLEFEPLPGLPAINAPGGFGYCLGTRHSNAFRYALRVAVGGRVFVCDNGALVGEEVISRKHTTGIDLVTLADRAVQIWAEKALTIAPRVNRLAALDFDGKDAAVNNILVRAAEEGLFSWSVLGKVHSEYHEPRHEEFKPRTGWSLYNAGTEIAKEMNPARQIKALDGFRDLILAAEPVTPSLN